ncbi:hypothetical protein HJG60_010400 [Phyllostomus discolor]|uniref:Uncharacterized protein n=1 Tax=Phyllostomus discolor TaxID=89673 RepID=A0A834B013_9CHIR|nr:hypothetical protein HJG60_010400 [Phyllostomus discolor]
MAQYGGATAHAADCSTPGTGLRRAPEIKNDSCDSLDCNVALSRWSGTELTAFLRRACIRIFERRGADERHRCTSSGTPAHPKPAGSGEPTPARNSGRRTQGETSRPAAARGGAAASPGDAAAVTGARRDGTPSKDVTNLCQPRMGYPAKINPNLSGKGIK